MPELAAAFGFVAAKVSPFEADDLLASGVEQELAAGGSAVTMTSDRDAYQLVGERSSVLVPSRGGKPPELVGPEGVRERYGIEPSQVTDLIALRGDPSDAIPGARGIGAVSAADLLRRYGTLEGVIEHASELTPRQRESVLGAADDLRRYREVATMRRDLPVPGAARRGSRRRAGGRVGRDARAGRTVGPPPRPRLDSAPMRPDSLLIRGAGDPEDGEGLSPVLDRSTSFERWSNRTSPYARAGSPTAAEAEALLGALEEAHALTFASGMTAWSSLCFAVLRKDSILVIPDSGYYEVELLAAGPLTALGVEVRRYSPTDPDGFATACQGARLALIETPANPLMHVVDLDRAVRDAHAGGALLCCDNTVATPLLQRPLDHGADVTWQSATKSLAGHSDTLAGVLSVRDDELHGQILATRRLLGGVLAPDPAWLLLRGLRTLSVRLERQCASALALAVQLAEHPEVRAVHYPGLPRHPNHERRAPADARPLREPAQLRAAGRRARRAGRGRAAARYAARRASAASRR